MNLDVDDNKLIVQPRSQYYIWRWALVAGIFLYIVAAILLGIFVSGELPVWMICVAPMGLTLLALLAGLCFMVWDEFVADWLLEKKH